MAANAPPGPETSPGAVPATAQALPQAEDEEAWRRERRTAQAFPRSSNTKPEPKPTLPKEPPPSPTALRVEYAVKVTGGTDVVAQVNSRFDLPLGLLPECIAATDASFGEVLNRILFEPLQIRVRGYLQSQYEKANRQEGARASNPAGPLQNGRGQDDPGNAQEFARQEGGHTCTSGSDPWPESLDEVAKLAGFPDGLGTKKKPKG